VRGFYFVSDSSLSHSGVIADVRAAVDAGVAMVQYRDKRAETRQLYNEARLIKEICSVAGTRLIINDRIDIALAVDADGVHIGQDDMPYEAARRLLGPSRMIGVTVHNVEEAVEAEKRGADYLGVSPIFATGTKIDAGAPCGTETLTAISRACRLPLAAIGGIDLDNVDEVIAAGADMVCAISAVVNRSDVRAEIIKFSRKFQHDTD
jgi:thiamine-phosphate pyrophosphorylase